MYNTIFDMGWSLEKTVEEFFILSIFNKESFDMSVDIKLFYPMILVDKKEMSDNDKNYYIIQLMQEKLKNLIGMKRHGIISITDGSDVLGKFDVDSSDFVISSMGKHHDMNILYNDVKISSYSLETNCEMIDKLMDMISIYGYSAIEISDNGFEKEALKRVYNDAIHMKWYSLLIKREPY
jgi:hypothetical protein